LPRRHELVIAGISLSVAPEIIIRRDGHILKGSVTGAIGIHLRGRAVVACIADFQALD